MKHDAWKIVVECLDSAIVKGINDFDDKTIKAASKTQKDSTGGETKDHTPEELDKEKKNPKGEEQGSVKID